MNDTKLLQVPIDQCAPAPWANRADLNLTPEFLADIKNRGVRQSLEVRPLDGKKDRYEIIAGVRRWSAARLGKLDTVPVIVVSASDQEGREARLIENLHRDGLTALDEAAQYQEALSSGDYGPGSQAVEALAAKVGKSRSHVYARLRLLKLNPAVRKAVTSGQIDQTIAELVSTIPDSKGQEAALKEIVEGRRRWDPSTGMDVKEPMSFRDVKELVSENFRRPLAKAPFDVKHIYASLAKCGTCEACPKRSGNFPDLAKGTDPNLCTDVTCYDAKADAEWKIRSANAEKLGRRIIEPKEWQKIEYRSGLVRLDGETWVGNGRKRLAGLCAKAIADGELKVALVRDEDGEMFEVVPEQEARKAAGLKEPSYGGGNGGSTRSASDKAREAKKKLKLKTAAAAVEPALLGLRKISEKELWQRLAQAAYDHTSIDAHAFVAKRRGLARVVTEARNAMNKWLKTEHTADELHDMTLELLLLASHGVNIWDPNYTKSFKECCALAKVDLDKLEKQVASDKKKPAANSKLETRNSKPAAKTAKPAKVASKAKK